MMTRRSEHAFTMIELIVTLGLVGLIAGMSIPFFMSGATLTSQPLDNLLASSSFRSVMANMVADYNNLDIIAESPDPNNVSTSTVVSYSGVSVRRFDDMVTFKARIDTPGQYGTGYTVVQSDWVLFGNQDKYDSLLITIQSTENPGETLTHLFSTPAESEE